MTLQPSKVQLQELQNIISRMPLDMCCMMVVQEFGINWREVSKAIRATRLPMMAPSVGRILCRHAAKHMLAEDVYTIIQRLRLRLVAIQDRTWHIIDLLEPIGHQTIDQLVQELPTRVTQAVRQIKKGDVRPEVHSILLNDLLYFSITLHTRNGAGGALYVCGGANAPAAAVSSLSASVLACAVIGLGYKRHEDAKLYGKDLHSLFRIHNKGWTADAECLDEIPEYNPVPTITSNGIDYTNKTYNSNYVETILGPDPPLLTEINIESKKTFFDPSRSNQVVSVNIQLKSEDVAKTLKSWVDVGALKPTSEFFTIFTKVKGNRLVMNDDDME